jgi:hypothetical protein
MQLSSVVVLPGVEAPNASRSLFIMRPFDQELQTSKRYWQSIVCGWTAWCGDGNSYPMTMPFPVNMRVAPTLDASNMTAPGTGGNIAGYPQYSAQPNYFGITLASGGAKICGASGFMKLDARL